MTQMLLFAVATASIFVIYIINPVNRRYGILEICLITDVHTTFVLFPPSIQIYMSHSLYITLSTLLSSYLSPTSGGARKFSLVG